MNYNANQTDEVEIDLIELAMVLWKKIWLLILCFLIGFGAAGAGSKFLLTPMYQSSATIYIFSKSTSITSLADIQIGNQLTVDFQLIAETREVLEEVIQKLNLNTTYEELSKQVVVTNPNNSHMLKITVTNPDPKQAADISNALADILREQVAEIMNTDKPSTVEKAIPAERPSSPHVGKNALIGGLALAFCVAAVLVIRYMMDDTIKTDEDVKKYLGIEVLAAIPYDRTIEKHEEAQMKKHRSGSRGKSKKGSAKNLPKLPLLNKKK
jgi:capsular polysaccharide biosynthesis protein